MAEVVGKVQILPIDSVAPNDWNPNEMDAQQRASLKAGLVEDGWLSSQALLIWGKDHRGKDRNLIIDGEHRWTVARELEFKTAPMVVLNGLKPDAVRKLTIAMNARRGQFNDSLGDVLRSIQSSMPSLDLSLSLGFDPEELFRHLRVQTETVVGGPARPGSDRQSTPPAPTVSQNASVQMVPLFLNQDQHAAFVTQMQQLGASYETDTVSSTILEALRRADSRPAS